MKGPINENSTQIGGDYEYAAIELHTSALDLFFRQELSNYEQCIITIASKIVNENVTTNDVLQNSTGIQPAVVDHVIDLFEIRGFVELARTMGATYIESISPELKRMLR